MALAVLAERAGVPAGLFSVLTGPAEAIGSAMTSSQDIRVLTFTGSTRTGMELYRRCAPTIKKLALELGGNAPFIVFEDADLDAAVEGAMIAKFRNNGQTCVCANRFYVQSGVYEEFARKFAAAVSALNGARIIAGGQRHALGGNFYQPSILCNVTSTMDVAREETFRPLAPLFRFENEADVIAQANATEFGLASYFYAADVARVFRVAEALEYGIVGVNTGLISTAEAPFGGVKMSGLGREGSRHGIEEYTEIKYICLGGIV